MWAFINHSKSKRDDLFSQVNMLVIFLHLSHVLQKVTVTIDGQYSNLEEHVRLILEYYTNLDNSENSSFQIDWENNVSWHLEGIG